MLVTVLDDAFLADWCDRHLGARPACVLFRSGHLSEVVAAELADGRRVVIKARPSDPRIAGCTAVQEHLARAGFPCPEPLAVPVQAGWLTVTAEAFVSGGSQLPADGGAGPFAALLARLISSAPSPKRPSWAWQPPSGRPPGHLARPPASSRPGISSPATSGRPGGSGRNRRSRTPGPPACGSACSTRRKTLPRAADPNSAAWLAKLTTGWPRRPSQTRTTIAETSNSGPT